MTARGTSIAVGSASSSLVGRHELRPLAASTTLALSRRWLHSVAQARQASSAAVAVKNSSSVATMSAGVRLKERSEVRAPQTADGNWIKVGRFPAARCI